MLLTTQPFCQYWHSRWEKPLTAKSFYTNKCHCFIGKVEEKRETPNLCYCFKEILLCVRGCQSTPSAKGLATFSAILTLFSGSYLEDLTNSHKAPGTTDHKRTLLSLSLREHFPHSIEWYLWMGEGLTCLTSGYAKAK